MVTKLEFGHSVKFFTITWITLNKFMCGGSVEKMVFNSMLSVSNSGTARPSPKMERNGSEERNGRYFSDTDTNIVNTNEHMIVKN